MNRRQLMLAAFPAALTPGCIGSFALTGRILEWNRGFSPIVSEVVFLVFLFFPVYEVAVFLDAIVFNTLEFFTGSNPVAKAEGEDEELQQVDVGPRTRMRLRRRRGGVEVTLIEPDGSRTLRRFEASDAGARVYDENDELLAEGRLDENGAFTLRDPLGRELRCYHPHELLSAQGAWEQDGVRGLTDAALEIEGV